MASYLWCLIAVASCMFAPCLARLFYLCCYTEHPRQWSPLTDSRRLAMRVAFALFPIVALLMYLLDNHVFPGVAIGFAGLFHAAFQLDILLERKVVPNDHTWRQSVVTSLSLMIVMTAFVSAPFSGLLLDESHRRAKVSGATFPAIRAFPSHVQEVVLEDRTCYQIHPRLLSGAPEKYDRPVVIEVPMTPESEALLGDYKHRFNVPPVLEVRVAGTFKRQGGYLVYRAESIDALRLLSN